MGYLEASSIGMGMIAPSVSVKVDKLGNGYVISLQTHPKSPPSVVLRQNPFEGMDPDELIDKLIDGMGALLRTIHDEGAGENWKDSDDRSQVREAFRVMFPQMARSVDQSVASYEQPRYDNLVFQSKKDLMEYLDKNL